MKFSDRVRIFLNNLYDYFLIRHSRVFDRDYYSQNYIVKNQKHKNPLWHFVRFGWRMGNNPSADFDMNFYKNAYPDVKLANINPLRHYIEYGREEKRATRPLISRKRIEGFLNSLPLVKNGVIFISHETSRTGAPINLLHLINVYKSIFGDNFIVISMAEGDYLEEFQKLGNFISLSKTISLYSDELFNFFFIELYNKGYTKCIANSIFTGTFMDLIKQIGIKPLFLINELPATIRDLHCNTIAQNLSNGKVHLVFPSQWVADQFSSQFGLHQNYVHIVPQSVRSSMRYGGKVIDAKKTTLSKLNIEVQDDTKVVLGAGRAQYLKGTDLFIDVVRKLFKLNALDNIHFLWLGDPDSEYAKWIKQKYQKLPYKSHLHFINFEKEPAYLFAGSDLYLLTSRQDTYPSTALEALANNTPVIMFSQTGGIEEILDGKNGIAVPHLDTLAMAKELLKWLAKEKQNEQVQNTIYTYQDYLHRLMMILDT